MSQGLLYVATGKQYVVEAIESYKSILELHPDYKAVLYTDSSNEALAKAQFQNVEIIEQPVFNFLDKIEPMLNSPFEKTLFIDTDTYLNESIDQVWQILDDYDIAITFDNGRINDHVEGVPDWFCEFSTGVILYNKSPKILKMIEQWQKHYIEMHRSSGLTFDQPSFRKSLWEVKPSFFLLPQEYNFSTYSNNITANNYPVKIFHCRYRNIEDAINYLNSKKPTLYINDFRFLELGTLKSFNYSQSRGFLFKVFMASFNFFYRITYRLGISKNMKFQKRKGNN